MSLSHCIHQTLNSKASTRFHSGGLAIQRLMNAMRQAHADGWKECRSEERFSRNAETDLVCRLLLEKKKLIIRHEQPRLHDIRIQPVTDRLRARIYQRRATRACQPVRSR